MINGLLYFYKYINVSDNQTLDDSEAVVNVTENQASYDTGMGRENNGRKHGKIRWKKGGRGRY